VDAQTFNDRILLKVRHRPWPMPDGPWVMKQTWHDLLFAHWPIDPRQLSSRIPPGLPLDLHAGQAWLGIVPFHMTNVAPRGVPALPWVSAFPELNVRTYVTLDDKPGVYFFSLDTDNPLAVAAGRLLRLPYFLATMMVKAGKGGFEVTSQRTPSDAMEARLVASYKPAGIRFSAVRGSLEFFLTERYCLYTVDAGQVRRLNIHHPPWRLQPATATFHVNTMTDPIGLALPAVAPTLHFAKRQDMVAWLPEPVFGIEP
jgi:uncharacterized protein YqjF (DUF2071 family)